jgi:hypothetical protein
VGFIGFRHQVHAGNAEWKTVGVESGNYTSTLIRWLKGRQMKRMGPIVHMEVQELAYVQSLRGIKKFIAKTVLRIARRKRKKSRHAHLRSQI